MTNHLPPPITEIHLPPPYHRSRGDLFVLMFIAVSIAIGIWQLGGMLSTSDAVAWPTMVAVTPIQGQQATKLPVLAVAVTNWPTAFPEPTTHAYRTPTPGYPACPTSDGQVCQVTAPIIIVTPRPIPTPPTCDDATLPNFTVGQLCTWREQPMATAVVPELWP